MPHKYQIVKEPGKDGLPGIQIREGGDIGFALYDLIEDPSESINLADENPEVVEKLSTMIKNFEEDLKNNSREAGIND